MAGISISTGGFIAPCVEDLKGQAIGVITLIGGITATLIIGESTYIGIDVPIPGRFIRRTKPGVKIGGIRCTSYILHCQKACP